MSYEQRDNSGALFKADKGENPARPDYKGDCLIGGVKYEIAAWIKEGRSGKKFMSLSFKIPQPKQDAFQQQQTPAPQRPYEQRRAPVPLHSISHPDLNDDISDAPF